MVTKKEKEQASDRSGSGARGKTHTGGGRDQQGGGNKASSGGRVKAAVSQAVAKAEDREAKMPRVSTVDNE